MCADIGDDIFNETAARRFVRRNGKLPARIRRTSCDDECNLCGEKRTPKHYFGEWTVVKEATNDKEGLKERTCVRCNVKQQSILQKTAVPEPQKEKILSKSDIAGIVVGSVAAGGLVAFIGATLIKKRRKK